MTIIDKVACSVITKRQSVNHSLSALHCWSYLNRKKIIICLDCFPILRISHVTNFFLHPRQLHIYMSYISKVSNNATLKRHWNPTSKHMQRLHLFHHYRSSSDPVLCKLTCSFQRYSSGIQGYFHTIHPPKSLISLMAV